MVEESSQWQGFSPGGALGGPESGRVAVGSVRPHAPTWSCDAAGLPEPPGTSPVPAPHPGRRAGWAPHSTGGGGAMSEFLESRGLPWSLGRMSSQGGPCGQGPGQEWMEGVAQVGPARDPGAIEFLLPAMGGSVLQLRPPALTPAPSRGGAEGTCLQARTCLVLVADGGAWLPPPAQRPRLQPLPAHPGHRHPLWGCQAVSFLSSRLPSREAPEGLGALALVRFEKRLLHCPHKNKLQMTPLVPSTFQVPS